MVSVGAREAEIRGKGGAGIENKIIWAQQH